MKFLLLILFVISSAIANAELSKGHYVLVRKEYLNANGELALSENVTDNCSAKLLKNNLQFTSCCIELDVLDNNRIFFATSKSLNTDITAPSELRDRCFGSFYEPYSSNSNIIAPLELKGNLSYPTSSYWDNNKYNLRLLESGDYLVDLIAVDDSRYFSNNMYIALSLNTNPQNEIELFVYRRIVHLSSTGLLDVLMNKELKENVRYCFKQVNTTSQSEDSIQEAQSSYVNMIELLGVSYGNYVIHTDNIIWKTQVSEEQAIELQSVDKETFKVLSPPYSGFYLIHSKSKQIYSNDFVDYAKDKNRVYYQGVEINDINPDDFHVIDHLYAKSGVFVYCMDNVIAGADVESFISLNGGYAMDKNCYYRNGKVVKKDKNIKNLLQDKEDIKYNNEKGLGRPPTDFSKFIDAASFILLFL